MKKILFIMPSMFIGGAERSLIGVLEALKQDDVEISLFLYRHEGEFLQHIPPHVKLLPQIEQYRTFDVPIKSLLMSKKFYYGITRIASKVAMRLHCLRTGEEKGVWMSMQYTSHYLQPLLPDIPGEYDLAIMFLGFPDVLVKKVHAKKKLAWCHTDYDSLAPNRKMDLVTYDSIDNLVAVSQDCADKICRFYPMISDKILTFENVLATDLIHKQSLEHIDDMIKVEDEILLLSIGRFCYAKNFDNISDICAKLRKAGLNVKWYLIGFGGDEELIRQKIFENKMEDFVVILGKKTNPYPYIKACDLYVQPSRYEGKCVTVREAQMLGKPVVITRYATSSSQLEDGVDGVIVPMDNESCARGIAELLNNPKKMKSLSDACNERDYSNCEEAKRLYTLL